MQTAQGREMAHIQDIKMEVEQLGVKLNTLVYCSECNVEMIAVSHGRYSCPRCGQVYEG